MAASSVLIIGAQAIFKERKKIKKSRVMLIIAGLSVTLAL